MHNLLQLTKAAKVSTSDIYIDPAILFIRLLVLVERSENPVSYFQYELTPYPASIFYGDYMRHVNKVLLGHAITDKKKEKPKSRKKQKYEETEQVEDEGVSDENYPEDLTSQEDIDKSNASKFVLDGGALLHHVTWKGSTFKEVVQDYISYVNFKYGLCTVVFDGYESISTKDHEHRRRAAQVPPC